MKHVLLAQWGVRYVLFVEGIYLRGVARNLPVLNWRFLVKHKTVFNRDFLVEHAWKAASMAVLLALKRLFLCKSL